MGHMNNYAQQKQEWVKTFDLNKLIENASFERTEKNKVKIVQSTIIYFGSLAHVNRVDAEISKARHPRQFFIEWNKTASLQVT